MSAASTPGAGWSLVPGSEVGRHTCGWVAGDGSYSGEVEGGDPRMGGLRCGAAAQWQFDWIPLYLCDEHAFDATVRDKIECLNPCLSGSHSS